MTENTRSRVGENEIRSSLEHVEMWNSKDELRRKEAEAEEGMILKTKAERLSNEDGTMKTGTQKEGQETETIREGQECVEAEEGNVKEPCRVKQSAAHGNGDVDKSDYGIGRDGKHWKRANVKDI